MTNVLKLEMMDVLMAARSKCKIAAFNNLQVIVYQTSISNTVDVKIRVVSTRAQVNAA